LPHDAAAQSRVRDDVRARDAARRPPGAALHARANGRAPQGGATVVPLLQPLRRARAVFTVARLDVPAAALARRSRREPGGAARAATPRRARVPPPRLPHG